MDKLSRDDLYSLEDYAEARQAFRQKVMAHKKNRHVPLGPNVTLYFEDRLTMQYQVQEMLRVERIYEKAGIEEELAAYNPLIPDGSNWKVTMMIEVPDEMERRKRLAEWLGIEHTVWARVGDLDPVTAIADEDMERADAAKTSSVHFLRLELTPEMVRALKDGAPLALGVAHEACSHTFNPVPDPIRLSLLADLK